MGFGSRKQIVYWRNSNRKEIDDTLKDVYLSLDERGNTSINQIVGYVLSGDPALVIPRYNNARNQILVNFEGRVKY